MQKMIYEIKESLNKQGLSETQLGKMVGEDQSKINRLLRGATKRLDMVSTGPSVVYLVTIVTISLIK